MKRSGPGDREQAKELLQQVVQNNLEGKQQRSNGSASGNPYLSP